MSTAAGTGPQTLDPAILDWVRTSVGPVRAAMPHPAAGRSREMWLLKLELAGEVTPAILRRESGFGPWSGTPFTLRREAAVLQALHGHAVPLPECFAVSDDGALMVMELLNGTAAASFNDDGQRETTMRSFLDALVRLHHLDIAAIQLPIPVPADSPSHALLDLGDYVSAYRQLCPRHDFFEEVVAWLEANAPQSTARTSMLHGDAGPGNFMHHKGVITGLIDWEMAHVGEPEDDLAWLWFRTQMLEADPHLADYYRWYEELSGGPIDRDGVLYYRVLVLARCAAANLFINRHRVTGPRAGLERVLGWLRTALLEAGGPTREPREPLPPVPESTPR